MPYNARQNNSKHTKGALPWVEGMKMPPGGPHPRGFETRTKNAVRTVGSGTIDDPRILWVHEKKYVELSVTPEEYLAIEGIVREHTYKYGLKYAWIAKEGHGLSTVRTTKNERVQSHDDWHITLRMGLSEHICNLHGHFYIVVEDNAIDGKRIRMMEERERGVVGGKNPQLWVWGKYPDNYPRMRIKYPEAPYEIVPDSILDMREIQTTQKPR